MTRNRAIAVIAVIGVAIGAWWWTHRATDATQVGKPAPAAQKPSSSPRGERRADEESAQMPVLVDDDPRGALRLEGVVFDSEEHPVQGATVALGANPPRTATTDAGGAF